MLQQHLRHEHMSYIYQRNNTMQVAFPRTIVVLQKIRKDLMLLRPCDTLITQTSADSACIIIIQTLAGEAVYSVDTNSSVFAVPSRTVINVFFK